jgi:hypothetical protein
LGGHYHWPFSSACFQEACFCLSEGISIPCKTSLDNNNLSNYSKARIEASKMLVSLLKVSISNILGFQSFVRVPAGIGLANQEETSCGWTPSNEGTSET